MSSVLPSTNALIPTEQMNPRTVDIDTLSTEGVLQRINAEDQGVALVVAEAIPQIATVIDQSVRALREGDRLIYVGAGTSGRLGVLDAAECPPTYSVPAHWVQAVIAGGEPALTQAVEGAEDDGPAGVEALKSLNLKTGDVVVGLSASGGAPFVVEALRYARQLGCFTAGLACVAEAPLLKVCDQPVVVVTGPEVIAGSTRMKAGTAQKLVLNMITTTTMIQLGKTYGNLMVDVSPTNQKLRHRAARLVSELAGVSLEAALELLEKTQYQVKPAVVMQRLGCSFIDAQKTLNQVGGKLKQALEPLS